MGKHSIQSKSIVFSDLLVGLSLEVLLGFVDGWGVFGLWWGLVIGFNVCAFTGAWYLKCLDWGHQTKNTPKRVCSLSVGETNERNGGVIV